jgi:hypothetical protein
VNRGLDVDVILDLMIHDLDLALLATRSRITEIHAVGVPVLTSKIDIANARSCSRAGASRTSRRAASRARRSARSGSSKGANTSPSTA